jgi:hypothetical protein
MMQEITIKIHEVAVDGLPDMKELVGRVAFIWDGAVVSGWPIDTTIGYEDYQQWSPSEDRFGGPYIGVTHWVEFPVPVWDLER